MPDFRLRTGSLATDFVATLGRRLAGGLERLASPDRLAEWFDQVSIPATAPTEADLADARTLREALYRVLLARLTERNAAGADLDVINAAARHQAPAPELTGEFTVRMGPRSVRVALGAVALDGIDLAGGARAESLRACEQGDCGMLYLDKSQGRNRRWCSMRECGNRAKAAAYRARQAN